MNTVVRTGARLASGLLLVGLLPAIAAAHVGTGPTDGFTSGLAHPLGGLDHLCAMLGVGLWAAQRGGRAVWLVPLAFIGVMALGGLIGMAGVALPLVETGIIASVLVVGILVAAAVRMPLAASAGLVGLFALVHGHAHGMEAPAAAAGLLYSVGFLTATMALLGVGLGLGWLANRTSSAALVRYAGAAIALCGIYLCLPH